MKRSMWKEYRRFFIRLAVFLLLLYLAFMKVLFLKQVKGMDMFPSLKDGDLVLGYRLQKEFRTNDIIAYEEEGTLHFGRVIAKEGDQVKISDGAVRYGIPIMMAEIWIIPSRSRKILCLFWEIIAQTLRIVEITGQFL